MKIFFLLSLCIFYIAPITAMGARWRTQPVIGSTKIKIITSNTDSTLRSLCYNRLNTMHFSVDTRSTQNDIYTLPKEGPGQRIFRFHYQISGNIIVISGEYQASPFGGTSSFVPIQYARAPNQTFQWELLVQMSDFISNRTASYYSR